MPPRPMSTYRLQIRPAFDLDAAAAVAPLPARPRRRLGLPLAAAARDRGLGPRLRRRRPRRWSTRRAAVARGWTASPRPRARRASASSSTSSRTTWASPTPAQNPWWWDVLTHGRGSRYADSVRHRLGVRRRQGARADPRRRPRTRCSPTGDGRGSQRRGLRAAAAHGRGALLRPRAPARPGLGAPASRGARRPPSRDPRDPCTSGSTGEPMFWRREAAELNYRRFFAITTLAGIRVEVPWVFDETHAEVLRWVREGLADGLRIDHPDGLADPGGYLERARGRRRAARTCWSRRSSSTASSCPRGGRPTARPATTRSPRSTACWSTPRARRRWTRSTRSCAAAPRRTYHDLIHDTKRMIADTIQRAEVAPPAIRDAAGRAGRGRRRRASPSCSRASRCTARTCRPARAPGAGGGRGIRSPPRTRGRDRRARARARRPCASRWRVASSRRPAR